MSSMLRRLLGVPGCPKCGRSDNCRARPTLRNGACGALAAVLYAVSLWTMLWDDPPALRFDWRCANCGHRFRARANDTTGRPRGGEYCRRCGYRLTGNLSGVCPECGRAVGP